jgi:hypothetical protein
MPPAATDPAASTPSAPPVVAGTIVLEDAKPVASAAITILQNLPNIHNQTPIPNQIPIDTTTHRTSIFLILLFFSLQENSNES